MTAHADSTRDRAVSLLGQGFNQSTVASALGLTPAYISQMLEVAEVAEEVGRLRAGKLQDAVEADTKLDTLEKQALRYVEQKLPFVRSPLEAVRVFSILNAAKRKSAPAGAVDQQGQQVIQITLPSAALGTIAIQLNTNNQVVEVDGRSMAPLPSKALSKLLPADDTAITDVTPKVTNGDIQQEMRRRLAEQDAARAARILETVRSAHLTTTIDGKEVEL